MKCIIYGIIHFVLYVIICTAPPKCYGTVSIKLFSAPVALQKGSLCVVIIIKTTFFWHGKLNFYLQCTFFHTSTCRIPGSNGTMQQRSGSFTTGIGPFAMAHVQILQLFGSGSGALYHSLVPKLELVRVQYAYYLNPLSSIHSSQPQVTLPFHKLAN